MNSRKGRVSSLPFFVRRHGQLVRAFAVAGSDSCGGAGIQADLKTFSAFGVYGMSAITAVTAQNSRGVQGVRPVPADFVRLQMETVFSDIGADGVKTGMLWNTATVRAVSASLRKHPKMLLVVDPVMASTGGRPLLKKGAIKVLKSELLPMADLVTPNIAEAEILSEMRIATLGDVRKAAEIIFRLGPKAVLIKGGHLSGDATDVLFDGREMSSFSAERIPSRHTHGTGCTYSAAILSNMLLGKSLNEAVRISKNFVTMAIRKAFPLGRGRGSLNHFVLNRSV
jgi:hydroxymethylpyrimidine kinase/phosphomethylpyrimidine kinase